MRSALVVLIAIGGAFSVVACHHDDGMVGTATIHSGTPEGPRISDARESEEEPEPTAVTPTVGAGAVRAELGDRLARAYCSHDRSCGVGDADDVLRSEESCFQDTRSFTRASIDEWPCKPATARAGFAECISAIREGSCSVRRDVSEIRECEGFEICRRSNIAGQ